MTNSKLYVKLPLSSDEVETTTLASTFSAKTSTLLAHFDLVLVTWPSMPPSSSTPVSVSVTGILVTAP